MDVQGNLMAFVATEVSVVLLALVMWIVPSAGRPGIVFWVPTTQDFAQSDIAAHIVRRFRLQVLALTGFGLVLSGACAFFVGFWAMLMADLVLIPGHLLILAGARRACLPHLAEPSGLRRAPLCAQSKRMPGGPIGQGLPMLMVLAGAGWLWMRWDSLPALIPSATRGQAAHLVAKSPLYFSAAFVFFLGFSSLITLICYGLVYQSRSVYGDGELGERASGLRRALLMMLTAVNYLLACMGGFVLAWPAVPATGAKIEGWLFGVLFGFGMLALLWTLIVWVRWRLDLQAAEKAVLQGRGSFPGGPEADERNWRCGHTFYYNREDPALWVQDPSSKRFTLNFARPGSWNFLVLLCISVMSLVLCMIVIPR